MSTWTFGLIVSSLGIIVVAPAPLYRLPAFFGTFSPVFIALKPEMDLRAVPPLLPFACIGTEINTPPREVYPGPLLVATASPSQRPSDMAAHQTPGEVYPEACRVGQAADPPLLFEFAETSNALVKRASFAPEKTPVLEKDFGEDSGVLAPEEKQKPKKIMENSAVDLENPLSPNSGLSRNMVSRGFLQVSPLQGNDPTPNLGLAGQVEVNQVVGQMLAQVAPAANNLVGDAEASVLPNQPGVGDRHSGEMGTNARESPPKRIRGAPTSPASSCGTPHQKRACKGTQGM